MTEPKPFASLSPGLLARKGQARPAMRPQLQNSLDDLGWNDMGSTSPTGPVVAPLPTVVHQQADIAAEFGGAQAASEDVSALMPLSRAGGNGKAAFTLRLDGERHLKLRIACALRRRSAQNIVTEALDAFLKTLPEVDAVAANLPAGAPRRGRTNVGMEE